MAAISDEKNREHVRNSRQRRARCYMLVKQLAHQSGYMANLRDTDGLDKFLDDHPVDGGSIDWFESITDL